MSALSERLSDADVDALARVLHAIRKRRADQGVAKQAGAQNSLPRNRKPSPKIDAMGGGQC
jgi:hypothetical protein